MVYENALTGSIFGALVAVVLAVASFLIESGLHGFFWLLSILCVFVFFGGLSDRYFKDPDRHERVEHWSRCILGWFYLPAGCSARQSRLALLYRRAITVLA